MARRLSVCVLGALALATAGCGGEAEELLPDLVQATPGAIDLVVEGDRVLLVFSSAVDNVGAGAIIVEGRRGTRAEPAMSIRQLVRRTDGSAAAYDVQGELRYVHSETHSHWHLLGFERYELRTLDGRLVVPDRKTGFCLGDRYETDTEKTLAGEPARPVWTQNCGRSEPERLRLRQGISPGFGDDYIPRLEGQSLDVTGVPAGRYRLVHRVNPERTLRESDYGNNTAAVVVELERRNGTPSVRTV